MTSRAGNSAINPQLSAALASLRQQFEQQGQGSPLDRARSNLGGGATPPPIAGPMGQSMGNSPFGASVAPQGQTMGAGAPTQGAAFAPQGQATSHHGAPTNGGPGRPGWHPFLGR